MSLWTSDRKAREVWTAATTRPAELRFERTRASRGKFWGWPRINFKQLPGGTLVAYTDEHRRFVLAGEETTFVPRGRGLHHASSGDQVCGMHGDHLTLKSGERWHIRKHGRGLSLFPDAKWEVWELIADDGQPVGAFWRDGGDSKEIGEIAVYEARRLPDHYPVVLAFAYEHFHPANSSVTLA